MHAQGDGRAGSDAEAEAAREHVCWRAQHVKAAH